MFYIAVLTAMSSFLAFGRELVLSYFYGTTSVTDVYLISLTIPTILLSIFAASIKAGFIPVYRTIVSKEEKKGLSFLTAVLFLSGLLSILLILLTFIFTDEIIRIFASGFNEVELSQAVRFTRITIISLFPMIIINVFNAYYNANNKFFIPVFVFIPYNIVLILSIVLSYNLNDTLFLPLGFLFATCIQLIFYYAIFKKLFTNSDCWFGVDKKDLAVFGRLIIPIIISVAITDINQVIDKTIASNIITGGIAALNYAVKLNKITVTIIVVSIVTVFFPKLSNLIATSKEKEANALINRTFVLIMYLILPVSVIFIIFSEDIVVFLFGRGQFDEHSIILTTTALFFYSWSIIPNGMKIFSNHLFFSHQNTKTPVNLGIFSIIVNIILNLVFYKYTSLGIGGLALATSISSIMLMIMLLYVLIKRNYLIFAKDQVSVVLRLLTSTLLIVILSLFLKRMIPLDIFDFNQILFLRGTDLRFMIICITIFISYVLLNQLLGLNVKRFRKGEF